MLCFPVQILFEEHENEWDGTTGEKKKINPWA